MSRDLGAILALMQAEFLDELPERLALMEAAVLALEAGTADAFNETYRLVHNLKGAGGSFGVPIISTICHQFETFLSQKAEAFGPSESTVALAYVDLLRRTLTASNREGAGLAALEQALETMRARQVGRRFSVLVVEASPSMQRVYQELLGQQAGLHLTLLASGLEALARLLHESYDLIVASRELPDLNAVALTAALRESSRSNQDKPVIIVTSNAKPVPAHLRVRARLKRDPRLAQALLEQIEALRT
ncbi:CheY-like chemotaxis protein [Inhella inkyongensis]|uniref:CheY-like chemotaxis protein n=1 Tax=Inhella inkyongensis TaxID=392593 RepID=A0A840S5X4_9BURK|nr:Hpt domain-containing protein [Inhella inkyongensis]MBB5203889.1 CheY-like chemotaxis protein [Inhella inkyongensis]